MRVLSTFAHMKYPQWLSLDRLLWIDGGAALVVGIFVLALRHFLAGLLGLPVWLLTLQSGITLCYAAYSLSLARRKHRPRWMLWALAGGNLAYSLFCVVLLFSFFDTCSALGVVYFLAEIGFMAALWWVERGYLKGAWR
jgi:hypothetical protein